MKKEITHDKELEAVQRIKNNHEVILCIISPPRCASTAFCRLFWQHPDIAYYSHEPSETYYYKNAPVLDIYDQLEQPIDLNIAYAGREKTSGTGLVIKDMPYQIAGHEKIFATLATEPVVFLIRDPLLNIYSRIQKKLEAGQSPNFPLIETGWTLIQEQIDEFRESNIPFMIIDTTILRTYPEKILRKIMSKMSLEYTDSMLHWKTADYMKIDNLDGEHQHLYQEVLRSRQLEPPTEPIPDITSFPEEGGLRSHVLEAIDIYNSLKNAEEFIEL